MRLRQWLLFDSMVVVNVVVRALVIQLPHHIMLAVQWWCPLSSLSWLIA